MQRWNQKIIHEHCLRQFNKIVHRKRHAHFNHDIHFLRRQINDWLPDAIERLRAGTYDPLPLKRLVFINDVVDQLSIPDRVIQNAFLHQLKPTFKYILNPYCHHMRGPSGVGHALSNVRRALDSGAFHYFIRIDIKSFYASITRRKLIGDIEKHYDDENVRAMLARIINNPTEVPNGIRNPDVGIALRGPLSQFFSGIYLKPLDDALSRMDVFYARYNDDCLVLCKSKRQLERARRKIHVILRERRLSLSSKKSRIGLISTGFHFLGANFLDTRRQENTTHHHAIMSREEAHKLTGGG